MRKPQGYLIGVGPSGVIAEADSFTCSHCSRIVIVRPLDDPANMGGHCRLCDKLICSRCVDAGCTPWEKKMEFMEARHEARRSYGLT